MKFQPNTEYRASLFDRLNRAFYVDILQYLIITFFSRKLIIWNFFAFLHLYMSMSPEIYYFCYIVFIIIIELLLMKYRWGLISELRENQAKKRVFQKKQWNIAQKEYSFLMEKFNLWNKNQSKKNRFLEDYIRELENKIGFTGDSLEHYLYFKFRSNIVIDPDDNIVIERYYYWKRLISNF